MNDVEVSAEMNKMVSFIKQEALEKAREIKVKADEEFNIEKAKLVAIEAFYQKKTKQADIQRKISISNNLNKARLKVLQSRHQVVQDLMQESRVLLSSLTTDPSKYQLILRDLILQGLYQFMESIVILKCRQKDVGLVKVAAQDARSIYEKKIKTQVNIITDETSGYLPDSGCGGVILSVMDGRIKLVNTLENRLELLGEKMLPDIRVMLFGPPTNRAFYN